MVESDPGLFLDEIQEQVYDNSGKLFSMEAVWYCLIQMIVMTLKKAKVYNMQKCLLRKNQFISDMEPIPAEFLVFTDKSSICSKDLLQTCEWSEKGTQGLKFQINLNA